MSRIGAMMRACVVSASAVGPQPRELRRALVAVLAPFAPAQPLDRPTPRLCLVLTVTRNLTQATAGGRAGVPGQGLQGDDTSQAALKYEYACSQEVLWQVLCCPWRPWWLSLRFLRLILVLMG